MIKKILKKVNVFMDICKEIKAIQRKKRITNPKMAEVIGVTSVNYSRKVNKSLLKANDIEKLCDFLDIEITIKEKEQEVDTN
jgi:DNA-binding Xre family transcriptional regulator